MRKKISVSLPCRNEEGNVVKITEAIIEQFETHLPEYDYEIQFIDNASTDNTRPLLRELCKKYPQVRAIFNVRNFQKSASYGLQNTFGDASISMASDFQNPPEMIPQFVREWENGAKIVCAIKTSSEENGFMWKVRSLYYKIINKFSSVEQLPHFTGFGLYDKSFMDLVRSLKDPMPTMRGVVAEFGYKISKVYYKQPKRKAGRSKQNFFSLFETAMLNFTSYTKIGLHVAMIGGIIISLLSFVVGLIYLIMKLIYWDRFSAGVAPVLIGTFFLGSIQIFFTGLLGEYVMITNARVINRPLVVEEERINFPKTEQQEETPKE